MTTCRIWAQYAASYAFFYTILEEIKMATVEITREHSLGKKAALERAQVMADKLAAKLDAKCSWQDDELIFQRSGVDGSILVGEKDVRVAVKLGMLLTPMAGMVKGEIEKALNKYLV